MDDVPTPSLGLRSDGVFRRWLRRLGVAAAGAWASSLCAQSAWTFVASGVAPNLWGVAAAEEGFVAVGEAGTVLTSPDGRTWTRRGSGTSVWLVGAGHAAGTWVAVGEGGTILVSSDRGATWRAVESGTTERLNGVAFGAGRWLAVGENGVAAWSADAQSWHRVVPKDGWPKVSGWSHGVTYGHGQFVVTGQRGQIVRHYDAARLALGSVDTEANLEGVVFARHQFVAVGDTGLVLTSRDAVTWRGSLAPQPLRAVAYFNEHYVAAAIDGRMATSPDGRTWTTRPTGSTALLTAVAANEVAAVAVGFGGTILVSAPDRTPPAIAAGPEPQTAVAGDQVMLQVVATGAHPLTYQWHRDGNAVARGTRDVLVLPSVTVADAGDYRVTVTNAAGSVSPAAARVSVVADAPPLREVYDAEFAMTGAGSVLALLPLADGRLVVGGSAGSLRRLGPDGLVDATFGGTNPVGGMDVWALAHDAGRILVAGSSQGTGQVRRTSANGTPDASFVSPEGGLGSRVTQIAATRAGKVLAVTAEGGLVRLNADGRVDESFKAAELGPLAPPTSGAPVVRLFSELPEGRIIVAAAAWTPTTTVEHGVLVARLLADGALDPTFVPRWSATFEPRLLHVRLDGKIIVGSERIVSSFFGSWWQLERLNPDGTPDATFLARREGFSKYGGTMRAAVDAAGRIVVTLGFHNWGGPQVLRFTSDGELDPTLRGTGTTREFPNAIAALPDGRVVFATANRLLRVVEANASALPVPRPIPDSHATDMIVNAGETVSLHVPAAGGRVRYSWSVISDDYAQYGNGATTDRTTLVNVRSDMRVMVTARNDAGLAQLAPIRIHVRPEKPSIQKIPQRVAATPGRFVELAFRATGSGPLTYEWHRNGAPYFRSTLGGGNEGALNVRVENPDRADVYELVLTNELGSVRSGPIVVEIDPQSRLANLSARGSAGAGNQALVAGFYVAGESPKWVLVRGVGPALAAFGVSGHVTDPRLTLYDAAGNIVAENDDWSGAGDTYGPRDWGDLFPLAPGSADAVIARRLAPGAYTAQLSSADEKAGVGLVEIYENRNDNPRLSNVSARLMVGSGDAVGVVGFSVEGANTRRLLVRAVGPTLGRMGVSGVLPNPVLRVVNSAGETVAENDDWALLGPVSEAGQSVGAFPLRQGSRDAATVVTLPPGVYTTVVNDPAGASGVALVEVYALP